MCDHKTLESHESGLLNWSDEDQDWEVYPPSRILETCPDCGQEVEVDVDMEVHDSGRGIGVIHHYPVG